MDHPLIHDRGRGPELKGRRITVYDLVPYEKHGTYTDEFICDALKLSAEELAALRAYIAEHRDAVMAWDAVLEARFARGNPPEVEEYFRRRDEERGGTFREFAEWVRKEKEEGRNPFTLEIETPNDRLAPIRAAERRFKAAVSAVPETKARSA